MLTERLVLKQPHFKESYWVICKTSMFKCEQAQCAGVISFCLRCLLWGKGTCWTSPPQDTANEYEGPSAMQTACFTHCKFSPRLRDHGSSRHCEAKRIFEGGKFLFYSIETWQYSTLKKCCGYKSPLFLNLP